MENIKNSVKNSLNLSSLSKSSRDEIKRALDKILKNFNIIKNFDFDKISKIDSKNITNK
jgi:Asp-tRNA(Asn)/Glu-tRNA(Gln) amidotransferase C subunit